LNEKPIVLAKAFYLCFFLAVGALLPFLVLYYEQLGLTGQQIGLITGASPLVTMLSAALWGGIADGTKQHQRVLLIALLGIVLTVPFLLVTEQLIWLLLVTIILSFFTSPIMPLIDNAVLSLLDTQSHRYGKIRLWGAIGFGCSPPIVGYLIGDGVIIWAFGIYLVLIGGCILIARRLPMTQAESAVGSEQPSQDVSFWQKFCTLMMDRSWVLFLLVIFITGMSAAVMQNYLFLYMNQIGASETLMGIALSVAMLGEITLFVFSEWLLKRYRPHQLLMFAMLGHSVRLVLYSYISTPWLVLPVQILHGCSFALIWITAVEYAKQLAPPGMGATAQGILNSVNFGIASAIGSFIGGYLYQQMGPHLMFRWAGLSVLVGVALLVGANGRTRGVTAQL